MYFVTDSESEQERWTFQPTSWRTWSLVGTHLRFSDELLLLADAYQTQVLGSLDRPFLSIHARHGDFPCEDGTTETCFKSPRIYLDDVDRMRRRLQEEKKVVVGESDVVVFSVRLFLKEREEEWVLIVSGFPLCLRMKRANRGGRR